MKIYQLGTAGDRIVTVKKSQGQLVVTVKVKDDENKFINLPPKRWAAFRQVVDDINKNVKSLLEGDQNVKFLQHIGGAYYVSVTSGYRCVDFRKWFQPYDAKDLGDIKPTIHGVALRLNEWTSLCSLIDTINTSHSTLATALPCYFNDDHVNEQGWLNCAECHPFLVNLGQ